MASAIAPKLQLLNGISKPTDTEATLQQQGL